MALINPSNLYSGGQGILDGNRYMNFIVQQEAKKKAQDEATTKYLAKLPEKLNLAGVREIDKKDPVTGKGILNDISEWQQMWMQDKENIKKGGMAQQEYMSKFQDILSNIDKSKNRGKFSLELGKSKFKGEFSPRQKDLIVIDKIGRSIYDPESYKDDGVSEYGYQDLSSAVGTMTPKDLMAFEKATFGQFKPEYDETAGPIKMSDSGKILVTKKYKPESVRAIGEQAAALAKTNQKAQNYYEDLMTEPEEVRKATEALQKFVGPDELPDTPEKMAKGLMMAKALGYKVEEEEKDAEAERRFRKKLQDERIAAQLQRLRISEAGKGARLKTLMEGVQIDDVVATAKERGIQYPWQGKGMVTLAPLDQLDPIAIEDILGKKDKYGEYPINTYSSAGRKYIIINESGQVETPDGIINKETVINNTFNRTKGLLKSTYRKEVLKPKGTTESETPLLNATQRRKN